MLAKTYKQQLEKMLARDNLKGKGLLRQFIWMNEAKPKYKIGDVVQFSSRGLSVYGNPVKHFVGKIVDIALWPRDKIIHYEISFITSFDGTNCKDHTAYCNEDSNEITGKIKQKNLINMIEKKTEDSDVIHI